MPTGWYDRTMKIVLTGAAGFIGSCFLKTLNNLGIHDSVIVDAAAKPDGIKNLEAKKFSDYLSREEFLRLVEAGKLNDVVLTIHLGACADTTEKDQAYLRRNNLEYSKSLAKWALGNRAFFHYASSAAVYGDGKAGYSDDDSTVSGYKPLNLYGESKWLFDKWLVQEKLSQRVVGYRYFNVFGPNEYHKGEMRSMVCKAFQQIEKDGKARLFATTRKGYGDGSEERDFVYVKDVCSVMAYFVEHPDRGGIFNLGTGQARSFKDLVTAVFTALEKKPAIDYIPMPENLRGQYQYFTQAEMEKLRQAGYQKQFRSLEDSVADYVKNHLQKANPYY
jgi:ADP-L-glycero-D-manno-heptose 6-epimerase